MHAKYNLGLRLFFCACFFNLLLASATKFATAGFLGDAEEAIDVPPEDFLDSLEAEIKYKKTLVNSPLTCRSNLNFYIMITGKKFCYLSNIPFREEEGVIFSSNADTILRGL